MSALWRRFEGSMARSLAMVALVATSLVGACNRAPEHGPQTFPAADASPSERSFDCISSEDGGARSVGVVRVSSSYVLTIVSVVPEAADRVRGAIDRMNQRSFLNAGEAPCPKGSGKFADCSKVVDRAQPEFFELLKKELLHDDGLELKSR